MLYAILAYHVEDEIASLTPQQDTALMVDLNRVHERLNREKRMGPAARLGATESACVLRGPGNGVVTDGPFTESKEVVGGFALLKANSKAEAIELARQFLQVAGEGECELRQLYEADCVQPDQATCHEAPAVALKG